MKMNILSIIGTLMILFGVATFAYHGFTYSKPEKVAELGNIALTSDTKQTVYIPPVLSGLALIAGLALVVVGRITK
jgi:hypothetical protein